MKKITTGLVLVGLACLAAAFGAGFAIYLRPSAASRNSAGTMSAINGPYVAGTTISSSVVNARLSDIETEITNSADRSGRGGFLAAVRGIDGTLAAPAFSWTSETGSGLFRNGAGDVRMSLLGANVEQWAATGPIVPSGKLLGIGAAPTYPLDVSSVIGFTHARFGSSFPAFVYSGSSATVLGFNLRHDGTNIKYDTTNFGYLWQYDAATGAMIGYTAPSGTAGNTATVTERVRFNTSGTTIGASGTAIGALKRYQVTWDPAPTGAGGCAGGTTVTATNAAVGEPCWAAAGVTVGAAWPTCVINSAGVATVNVCAFTNTDVANSTWNVWVLQATP